MYDRDDRGIANLTDVGTDLDLIIGYIQDHAAGWTQLGEAPVLAGNEKRTSAIHCDID
jgi:uncharacterized metal-binding protein